MIKGKSVYEKIYEDISMKIMEHNLSKLIGRFEQTYMENLSRYMSRIMRDEIKFVRFQGRIVKRF